MLVRSRDQNVPGKIGEASPVGYNQGKAAQWSTKHQVEWLRPRTCLAPSWCRVSRITTTRGCWKPWCISISSWDAILRPAEIKSVWEKWVR